MRFRIICSVTTSKGDYKIHNEDNFLIDGKTMKFSENDMSYGKNAKIPMLFAISDGMGGSGYGKEASYTALSTLREYRRQLDNVKDDEVINEIDHIIGKVNLSVVELEKKPGCTLALVYLGIDKIYLANIGDSRIYQYKNQKLHQLSIDHNQARELRDLGFLGPNTKHGMNKLTQYLGMSSGECIIEPHYASLAYDEALLLLCSDGLTETFSDEDLAAMIDQNRKESPKKISDLLVKRAMERGAKDNITAMIISIHIKGQRGKDI